MAPTEVQPLNVDIDEGPVAVVRATGELDLNSAARLAAAITEAATRDGQLRPRVVVDLVGLEFCDSTGLRALIGAVKEVEVLGGRAVVAATPQGAVGRLLTLSGLGEFLRVSESADAALRRL